MLEERISCQVLPKSFVIKSNLTTNPSENINKQKKIIEQLSRTILNSEIKKYEILIQGFERSFHQELITFQEISNHNTSLVNALNNYVIHQKDKNIKDI